MLVVTGVALYLVLPGLIVMFGSLPQLEDVFPAWFVPIFLLESAAFVCMWVLMRIALHTDKWFDVACSQLTGNALEPRAPRRCRHGRSDDVPDAPALGLRRRHDEHRAHRGRPVVDGDAVRAPRARAARNDLRAGGELGAVAGRPARWCARHLRADRRVDPARVRPRRARRRADARRVRAPRAAAAGNHATAGRATGRVTRLRAHRARRNRGSRRSPPRWATSCSTSSRSTSACWRSDRASTPCSSCWRSSPGARWR